MAGSVNKVILIGNVGKDPEMRTTQDGAKIANLSLATSESWNDKASGERTQRTEWHRVVCFNDRASEFIEKFVEKGAKVYVEGALQTRKWTDQQGQDRYTTEVVIGKFNGQITLLGGSGSEGGPQQSREQSSSGGAGGQRRDATPPKGKQYAGQGTDMDDDIPF